jgi:hypothetical protein
MESNIFNDEENIQEQLLRFLGNLPENFSVLEEQIDIEKQTEYFEKVKSRTLPEDINLAQIQKKILDKQEDINKKKELIVQLAGIETPEAYRVLENLKKELKNTDLFDWVALAFHENKMALESLLLEENQIFISTGLGGKGKKLRYFVVFISKTGSFTSSQINLLKSELEYSVKNNNCELENYKNEQKYITATILIPIDVNIKDVFTGVIDECNLLGDFLDENFIVTNVSEMSVKEIDDFIKNPEIK